MTKDRIEGPQGHPLLRLFFVLVVVMVISGSLWNTVNAQSGGSSEYKFKAAYLYNIIQFVDWPDNAFGGDNAPFIIGIVGRDPFGRLLDEVMADESVKGHPIMIQRFSTVESIRDCQVLFVSRSEKERFDAVIDKAQARKGVLTVADTEGFLQRGGIVNFYVEDNRLHFEVNMESLKASGLTASSKILRLARIVNGPHE